MKLGLLLKETDYQFQSDQRLGIYLTNTLEEGFKKAEQLAGFNEYIVDEANAAAEIKKDKPIMVVLGNPPYSGISANTSTRKENVGAGARYKKRISGKWEWATAKHALTAVVPTFIGELLDDYYQVDEQPLGERNPKWLQDDYVKFIRFGQWRIERTGQGILAFITNHSYLDNPTFRGMRQSLMNGFTDIYILNLHGNSKKKEVAPDGSKDENVFDIQQGVAIGLFVKEQGRKTPARVHCADVWGLREGKYKTLFDEDVAATGWVDIQPNSPSYLFIPRDEELRAEYDQGWKVTEVFPANALGFQTHRDDFAIDFEERVMRHRIMDLRGSTHTDEELRDIYGLCDNPNWQLSVARKQLQNDTKWELYFTRCLYRPFDSRFCYFSTTVMDRPRLEVTRHLLQPNLAFNLVRQTKAERWQHALVSDLPTLAVFVETFGPEDIFNYAYAIFHSPTYRIRYAEFLKTDFPRLPLTSDKELFKALADKGSELVSLHLMESLSLNKLITRYPVSGSNMVEEVSYDKNTRRVYINKTQYFEGVNSDVWSFQVGGYQVCQKWLKDRKGRMLTIDEAEHYQKIAVALNETIRLMGEIDALIPAWPLT